MHNSHNQINHNSSTTSNSFKNQEVKKDVEEFDSKVITKRSYEKYSNEIKANVIHYVIYNKL